MHCNYDRQYTHSLIAVKKGLIYVPDENKQENPVRVIERSLDQSTLILPDVLTTISC